MTSVYLLVLVRTHHEFWRVPSLRKNVLAMKHTSTIVDSCVHTESIFDALVSSYHRYSYCRA